MQSGSSARRRDAGSSPESHPPLGLPSGYVGPVRLPATGQMIWWTGRVAIGLRYQARRTSESEQGQAS
jgi:hypothetical protein